MLIDKLTACKFFYKFRNIYLIPYNVIQKKLCFFINTYVAFNLYGLLIKLCFPTTQKSSETISFPKYSRKDAENAEEFFIAHSSWLTAQSKNNPFDKLRHRKRSLLSVDIKQSFIYNKVSFVL